MGRLSDLLRRSWTGPLAAAAVAATAASPGLRFPFLSDDWHLVASVAHWPPPATPYDYFRPLYMATFWLDRALGGASPFFFHLTNLLLLAVCAALVTVLAKRYTGDHVLACATGLLFAMHPYHVENAAWIAVRGDPLYSILVLLSLLAYDRWRGKGGGASRGVPLAALAGFALALLAKETAIVLLPLLAALAILDPSRRPDRAEILRGYLPMALVGAAHLFVLRPLVLAGPGRSLTPGTGLSWIKHAFGFAVAALVPVDGEILAARPLLYGGAAALVAGVLVLLALFEGGGRLPRFALGAAAIFAVLLAPSIVGFQERYLYLPAAAACLCLAVLIRAQRRAVALAAGAVLVLGWSYANVRHWQNWSEAATASRAFIADLVAASRDPATKEIVIANVPFRVRGGSVAGDFDDALVLLGERPIPVRGLAYVSYPSATDDFLTNIDYDRDSTVDRKTLYLSIQEGPFAHYVGPKLREDGTPLVTPYGTIKLGRLTGTRGDGVFEEETIQSILVKPAPGRAAYAWYRGHLERRRTEEGPAPTQAGRDAF